jgi:phosphate transport system substrate-binding protein
VEAHRHHGRREDRQEPLDVCAGCVGGARGSDDDRGGGPLRLASLDDAGPLVGCRRNHGRNTFDYFTLAIVGSERSSRADYTKSEDDTTLVNGVASDPNALAYFGYAYYAANRDRLKLVAIDGGSGCVVPSMQTVAEHQYQPLARPIFVYVSKTAAARAEVGSLARFYVAPESARFALEVGYVPLPTVTLLSVGRLQDKGVTGSVFGGRGSVLGVTAEMFQDEERIKSALVR